MGPRGLSLILSSLNSIRAAWFALLSLWRQLVFVETVSLCYFLEKSNASVKQG